jgi:hypothetical protein
MTNNRVNQPTRGPRHLYDTGKFKTLPLEMRVRPKKFANEPKPAGPHAANDGSKVHHWPIQADAPTKVVRPPSPRPHVPSPAESSATVQEARATRKALAVAAAVVLIFGVVALLASMFGGAS